MVFSQCTRGCPTLTSHCCTRLQSAITRDVAGKNHCCQQMTVTICSLGLLFVLHFFFNFQAAARTARKGRDRARVTSKECSNVGVLPLDFWHRSLPNDPGAWTSLPPPPVESRAAVAQPRRRRNGACRWARRSTSSAATVSGHHLTSSLLFSIFLPVGLP